MDLLFQRSARTGDLRDPDTARLHNQVSNLIHRGLIASVDLAKAVAIVQVGEVQTAPVPWLTARAGSDLTWWAPEVGEHVVLLCPCGSLSQGVILGSLYSGAKPAPSQSPDQRVTRYSDGTTITYDRGAHKLSVQAVGTVEIAVEGEATVTAASIFMKVQDGIAVDGDLTLKGSLHLNGKVTGDLKVAGSVLATGSVVQNVPSL